MYQNEFTFQQFGFSSQVIRDLVAEKPQVSAFSGNFFSLDELSKQAARKTLNPSQRNVLVEQLNRQNEHLSLSALTKENMASLQNEKTMTITTGHQLNLLTGPLYSIYKVAQVISLTQEMNSRNDGHHYVPVFWMATEDHDFEEINHIHLFNEKISWEKEGQEDFIAGEIKTEGMLSFIEQVTGKYHDEELKQQLTTFTDAYAKGENLADATRQIMNNLFESFGLVIVDGNDAQLKKAFVPVVVKEVNEAFVHKAVTAANEALTSQGYHSQVYVRECNLFYIDASGKRSRIVAENGQFTINGEVCTAAELIERAEKNPASFSPNALLRPVYQELILPNVAYIGGGGEIAYWLQLGGVFKALDLTFPLLRVRDSLLLLNNKDLQGLQELELSIPDLKRNFDDLLKEIALQDVAVEIELKTEKQALEKIKQELLNKALQVSKGMSGMIEAEFAKMEKSIGRIEAKLIKAEKGKHDQKAGKLRKLQAKMYPNGGFQERYENFLPYFLRDSDFVSKIVDNLKPSAHPVIRVLEL